MTDPTDPRPAGPERSPEALATEADAPPNGVEEPSPAVDPPPADDGDDRAEVANGDLAPAEAEAPVEVAPPPEAEVEESLSEAEAKSLSEAGPYVEAEVESFADVESFAGPGAAPPPEADAGAVADIAPAAGELEWQPVYSGDEISWQPVVASEADEGAGQWEEQPPVDYEAAAGADWGVPEPGEDEAGLAPAKATRPAGTRTRPPDPKAKNRRMVVLLSVLTGVVVLVAVLGYVLSNGITSQTSGGDPATTPTTSATAVTLPESDFATYRDELTGLSVKYPKTWRSVGVPISDVRLTLDGGGNEAMRIRVLPIETPATVENIENYKAVTDGIAFSDPNNKLVKSQLIRLNGRLAYYYLYTYPDSPTGEQGVHAHYFVFEGHRMFMLVIQAVPADDFKRLAGVFDQIAESFTVPEERTVSTTTTPATTTSVP